MTIRDRKKSATRTIRLSEEQENALIKEAERRGYSVNALIGHIFDRYITGYMFFDVDSMLIINSATVNELLGSLDISEIKDIGDITGQARIRAGLMQRGRKINFESFKWYVTQVLGENYGWFRCDHTEENGHDVFHLSHHMGYKWSVFLESYLSSALEELLKIKCNTVTMNTAINIDCTR